MSLTSIVFVRHAHRNTSDRDADNGIDEKGEIQIRELAKSYENGKLPLGEIFWTSPKKRCVETLQPLAKLQKIPLEIKAELDEQSSSEGSREFHNRINRFLEEILAEATVSTIYLCSHGDVLPMLVDSLTGHWVDVKKGRATVCIKKGKSWNLG